MAEKLICSKCGKTKAETEFFKMRDGNRCDMCKACLTMYIDNRKPDTFMWILEKFDIPYIEDIWVAKTNEIQLKNPAKFGPMSVIGTYIRTLNMKQYKDLHFADSDRINFENKKEKEEFEAKKQEIGKDEKWEEELKAKLESGEISEAEYQTLSSTTPSSADLNSSSGPKFLSSLDMNDDKIAEQLTDEDVQYLALKWGILYKPSEWIKMEELYNKYAAENELNTDREDTLKKICKTSLKMDQALDVGDMQAYKNLSSVYDQLRKSAKFTEAQNKEGQKREIDAVGQLVGFVEQEGGIIPSYDDPIEAPKDIVDFIIKDIHNYINNLVRGELGLGDLIETFIEKADKNKEQTVEDIMNAGFKNPEDDTTTHEEEVSFQEFRLKEIEEESQKLAESFNR